MKKAYKYIPIRWSRQPPVKTKSLFHYYYYAHWINKSEKLNSERYEWNERWESWDRNGATKVVSKRKSLRIMIVARYEIQPELFIFPSTLMRTTIFRVLCDGFVCMRVYETADDYKYIETKKARSKQTKWINNNVTQLASSSL